MIVPADDSAGLTQVDKGQGQSHSQAGSSPPLASALETRFPCGPAKALWAQAQRPLSQHGSRYTPSTSQRSAPVPWSFSGLSGWVGPSFSQSPHPPPRTTCCAFRQWLEDALRENEPGSCFVFLVGTKKDLLVSRVALVKMYPLSAPAWGRGVALTRRDEDLNLQARGLKVRGAHLRGAQLALRLARDCWGLSLGQASPPNWGCPAQGEMGSKEAQWEEGSQLPGATLKKGCSPSQGRRVSRRKWRPCTWPTGCRPSTGRCRLRRVSGPRGIALVDSGQLWEAHAFPSVGLSSARSTASFADDRAGPSAA